MTKYNSRKFGGLLIATLGIVGLFSATTEQPAHADATNYAASQRQIKACVLVTSTNTIATGPQNATPHVFYIMDRRSDLKPAGWNFTNPLAPTNVTGDIFQRWKARGVGDATFDASTFFVGSPLTKNLGAYWEVNIDKVSSDELQQFDVILMAMRGNTVGFTPDQRDKLRRFVDGGGSLWLDDEGNFDINGSKGPFVVDVKFDLPVLFRNMELKSARHPLINYPFGLSRSEIQTLGEGGGGGRHRHKGNGTAFAAPTILSPLLTQGGVSVVSSGDYGAGHIIISTGVAAGINSYAGGAAVELGNSGLVCGTTLSAVRGVDIKFAYNLVAWTTSVPTAGVNPRRSASTKEQIGLGLGRKWATVPVGGNIPNPGSGAVIHKGVIFYVDGLNILHAYDASPSSDLDNDKDPDDGFPDYSFGTPYDEIWNFKISQNTSATVSTPTVVTYTNTATGQPQDWLVMTDSLGITYGVQAFPRDGNGRFPKNAATLQANQGRWKIGNGNGNFGPNLSAHGLNLTAPAPAYSEGILFAINYNATTSPDTPWRVVPVNPLTQKNAFNKPGSSAYTLDDDVAPTPRTLGGFVPGMTAPIAPLTVGYVRDEGTGALDKLIYVAADEVASSPGAGRIYALWFSSRHEPLDLASPNNATILKPKGTRALVPWFAPGNSGDANPDLLPVVYLVTRRKDTGVVTDLQTLRYANGDFQVHFSPVLGTNGGTQVELNNPLVNDPTFEQVAFADYTLNWPAASYNGGATPNSAAMLRFAGDRVLMLHGSSNTNVTQAFATGPPSLTSNDLLVHSATWAGGPADHVFAWRERYNSGQVLGGGSQVAWMFSPNGPAAYGDDILPPRLTGLVAGNKVFATGFKAIGSPVTSNGTVYVLGKAQMSSGGNVTDVTCILALRQNPNMTFSIGRSISDTEQISLKQVDLTLSQGVNATKTSFTEGINFVLDRVSGSITVINSLTGQAKSSNNDALNTALPIYVEVTGQGVLPFDKPFLNPTTGFGPLDNLTWFMFIPTGGTANTGITSNLGTLSPASSPAIFGDVLYYGTEDGRVASVDLSGISGNGGQANYFRGKTPFDGSLRVSSQFALAEPGTGAPVNRPIINTPLATTNLVAVGTARGVAALDNQRTLVADNTRLIEVDFAGNAVWSLDVTRSTAEVGGSLQDTGQIATTKVNLNRPNVAHRVSYNEILVADTGNNRIAQLDHGGIVQWELNVLKNDMGFLRPGDPMTLNAPTDVQTFNDEQQNGTISIFRPNPQDHTKGVSFNYTGYFFATHYLIADSGNYRALEVVDAYDGTGNPIVLTADDGSGRQVALQQQVVFVTRSLAEQNERFRYRNIQQFLEPSDGSVYMIASVDNARLSPGNATVAGFGTATGNATGPGGALAVFRRYNPKSQDGDLVAVINSLTIPKVGPQDTVIGVAYQQPILNPTWLRRFEYGVPVANTKVSRYMLADEHGCYEIETGANGEAVVRWMITAEEYLQLMGRPLRAACIQRLGNADYSPITQRFYPHYLITNRYTGEDRIAEQFFGGQGLPHGEVHGEVVEIRGLDYYNSTDASGRFNGYQNANHYIPNLGNGPFLLVNPNSPIVWLAPKETFPATAPYKVRRTIGSPEGASTSFLFEQPTFADRPF